MTVIETEVQNLSALAFTPDGAGLAAVGMSGSGVFSVPDGAKLRPLPGGGWARAWFSGDRLLLLSPAYLGDSPHSFYAVGPNDTAGSPLFWDARRVIGSTDDVSLVATFTPSVRHDPWAPPPERPPPPSVLALHDRTGGNWRVRWVVEVGEYSASLAAFSADGSWFETVGRSAGGLRLWNAASWEHLHTWKQDRFVSSRFHARRLLAFSRSHLYVWDAADWDRPPLAVYGGRHERLDDLAVHPDGRRAFLTNFASTVLVVDLPTGTVQTTMDWGVPLLSRVAVSPDGTMAAAANHGGQVVLWDLDG